MADAYIFGYDPSDTVPVPSSFWGQSGWFRVPTQWYVRSQVAGQIEASPNSDFSAPVYQCVLNENFQMVFQDLLKSVTA
jgi:hypothetical protein